MKSFTVEIRSDSDRWWCYNAAMMCGALDGAGQSIGFYSAESRVADVGANLEEPPAGQDLHRRLRLETLPCERIILYIYIVPHTLPRDRAIEGHPPFPLEVNIFQDGKVVKMKTLPVNRWGGASIELIVDSLS
jgi:hypothetical protein